MYSAYGFHDFEIGDVDVVRHEGVYHLFHLTLPNHDYIAHAISEDGLHWRRVKNALFISDPESWDDDMLWTMHVTPNPHRPGWWRMFYTGLCMGEHGRVQRIGLAHSSDLTHWHKDTTGHYPLSIGNTHYEHSIDEGRQWVSFRDPFCFIEDDQVYLLAAARVNFGPVIRRGCVSLAEETKENVFTFRPPLFHPMHYDDVEVPNLVKIHGRYFLIGSIREDIKVHYWYADSFRGPYRNLHDNVLLPQGNYAARVSQEDNRWLIWNFFYKGMDVKGKHLMAPPKELVIDPRGELRLRSFDGFERYVESTLFTEDLTPPAPLLNNPYGSNATEPDNNSFWVQSESGFEGFMLRGLFTDFIMSGTMSLEGNGKCGLLLRLSDEGDGYYISLDLFKGIAQIRIWQHHPDGNFEEAFHYDQLQAAHYVPTGVSDLPFRVVAYEQYLEFSLDDYVLLTLADDDCSGGRIGFYVESAQLRITDLQVQVCQPPQTNIYPTPMPN